MLSETDMSSFREHTSSEIKIFQNTMTIFKAIERPNNTSAYTELCGSEIECKNTLFVKKNNFSITIKPLDDNNHALPLKGGWFAHMFCDHSLVFVKEHAQKPEHVHILPLILKKETQIDGKPFSSYHWRTLVKDDRPKTTPQGQKIISELNMWLDKALSLKLATLDEWNNAVKNKTLNDENNKNIVWPWFWINQILRKHKISKAELEEAFLTTHHNIIEQIAQDLLAVHMTTDGHDQHPISITLLGGNVSQKGHIVHSKPLLSKTLLNITTPTQQKKISKRVAETLNQATLKTTPHTMLFTTPVEFESWGLRKKENRLDFENHSATTWFAVEAYQGGIVITVTPELASAHQKALAKKDAKTIWKRETQILS